MKELEELRRLVDEQADDIGLWLGARYIMEAYLQQELRKLHTKAERLIQALDKRTATSLDELGKGDEEMIGGATDR